MGFPINPDKVVIVGVPLMLSEDGGKTFKDLGKANVHVDHHAFWFNPKDDNHFINGNDGGVNISYDNGDTWFKANTPAVGQFYAVEVDNAELYNVYGGMQDNGVWYGPSTYIAGNGWYSNGQYPYKSIGGAMGCRCRLIGAIIKLCMQVHNSEPISGQAWMEVLAELALLQLLNWVKNHFGSTGCHPFYCQGITRIFFISDLTGFTAQ